MEGWGAEVNGQGLLKVTFCSHHKWSAATGKKKDKRRGRRHTLLDLLFEFMHKSNNTKRKKKKQK